MFITLTDFFGKARHRPRIGLGIRITKKNVWYMLLFALVYYMTYGVFYIMFYMIFFSCWLVYAAVYWTIKLLAAPVRKLFNIVKRSVAKNADSQIQKR